MFIGFVLAHIQGNIIVTLTYTYELTMKYDQVIDDDILNDVRNLFIEDAEEGEEKVSDKRNIVEEPKQPIVLFRQEPTVRETTEVPVIKEKIPQPTAPKTEQPVVTKTNPTKPIKEVPKNKTATPPPRGDNCKSNSDCNSDSFCITKIGKCAPKLDLNQSGCTSNDQCSDITAVCLSKTCKLSCKVGNDSMCKAADQGCMEVKDLRLFRGLKGRFNGICDKVKNNSTVKSSSTGSNKSIVLISGSIAILLTAFVIGFLYLRGYLKRRYRDKNPEMFLFNKLQRNASQTLSNHQQSNSVDRLNARLANVSGARFTKWTALSNESIGH